MPSDDVRFARSRGQDLPVRAAAGGWRSALDELRALPTDVGTQRYRRTAGDAVPDAPPDRASWPSDVHASVNRLAILTLLSGRLALRGAHWPRRRRDVIATLGVATVDVVGDTLARHLDARWVVEVATVASLASRAVAAIAGVPPSPLNASVPQHAVTSEGTARVRVSGAAAALAIVAPLVFGSDHGLVSADRPTLRRTLLDLVNVAVLTEAQLSSRLEGVAAAATVDAATGALLEERARIAREMHDVVAHELSVVTVQAGAAAAVNAVDPDRAVVAMGEAEAAARRGLVELRRLLGTLRTADGDAATAPLPGIGALDDVVRASRAAGLDVTASIDAPELPVGVALNVHRIVQEALTNALKHAGPTTVDVVVEVADGVVHLRVADRGPVAGAGRLRSESSGNGLVGMRERVDLFDGSLEVGPAPDGPGWVVEARLPIS